MSCVTWQATWAERGGGKGGGVRKRSGVSGVSPRHEAAWGYEDGGGSREKERGCGFTRDAAGNADVRDSERGAICMTRGLGVGLDTRREREKASEVVKRGGGHESLMCDVASKHERGGRSCAGTSKTRWGGSRTRWKGCSKAQWSRRRGHTVS